MTELPSPGEKRFTLEYKTRGQYFERILCESGTPRTRLLASECDGRNDHIHETVRAITSQTSEQYASAAD